MLNQTRCVGQEVADALNHRRFWGSFSLHVGRSSIAVGFGQFKHVGPATGEGCQNIVWAAS